MSSSATRSIVEDLRRGGRLVEFPEEVDPMLEAAEVQRRVYARGGPAVYFPKVRGCRFPLVSNLFASAEQARYLFRHQWERVKKLVELKLDPTRAMRQPMRYWNAPLTALRMLPKFVKHGAVQAHRISLRELPQVVSWPRDGGPFVTLPQVLSPSPASSHWQQINLGMYRVQIGGNDYTDNECGLHYQLRRGIGVHHRQALSQNTPLRVSITVGGHPAMTLAAVMPLPEGLSELTFAGALSGSRIRLIQSLDHAPVYANADFAIVGEVDPTKTKPEGPFGDHLGYYSLQHPFPFLNVKHVWHRTDAVWPFTVVGRPPQEDTTFGEIIHELTGPIIPQVLPGVRAVHAVDAAGVHPLLLAIGSEREMPFVPITQPQDLLAQAHAILGNGQLALAKYLCIMNGNDAPELDIHDTRAFLLHLLERIDWGRDLHFETRTSIDTLDYSGDGFNRGSKVVIAAVGAAKRSLPTTRPETLPEQLDAKNPQVVAPGILAVTAPSLANVTPQAFLEQRARMEQRITSIDLQHPLNRFPLVILCDDSNFVSRDWSNFLWVAFTRSQPATDLYGVGAQVVDKHWGCRGALVLDARIKPHHAPVVESDEEVNRKIDAVAARGGPIAKYL